jgi:hypothetical protein
MVNVVFVQHDSAGYKKYMDHHGIPKDNLATRLRFEIQCFKYIILENFTQFQGRQAPQRLNGPNYVVMDNCPLDLEFHPNYYEI